MLQELCCSVKRKSCINNYFFNFAIRRFCYNLRRPRGAGGARCRFRRRIASDRFRALMYSSQMALVSHMWTGEQSPPAVQHIISHFAPRAQPPASKTWTIMRENVLIYFRRETNPRSKAS